VSLRTFGGPAGQIAVMHEELVDRRRWIGEQRFLHALSYCTMLPGPEAQQLAIYLGWLLNGTLGGLIAGVLFVLPGYVALMALSAVYVQWGESTVVAALFAGLAPAVLAVVVQAVWRIGKRSLTNRFLISIAVAAFCALFVMDLAFPLVIAGAALAGFVGSRVRPDLFTTVLSGAGNDGPPPLIADDALHGEQPSLARAIKISAVGLTLWAVPLVAFWLLYGRDHVFVDQGLFFSGTAVVTFGGAYAVLSFVAQRAVEVYGWLEPGEMVHGLAMAETTPGPLIMVVQFVGFLGAYRNPGDLDPWLAGVIGATLVVWVTFVPCFLFVFLGAPHIEGLRHNIKLTAALGGITAAVVGVISNLSVFFSIHTLFAATRTLDWGPVHIAAPVWSSLSFRALFVTAVAFVLAFKYRMSVLRVLGNCAVIGAILFVATR
jgi:chromate transporter